MTAVDFMASFVEKNRQENGHHSNATFLQADVTKLDIPQNRCVLMRNCNRFGDPLSLSLAASSGGNFDLLADVSVEQTLSFTASHIDKAGRKSSILM